ncbi:hypothetical protein [Bradyrhizobium ottawaense]|uniref:hypothetical protein n=1 Tax=Bradyrhizobium ottawaense TaxID=931866 RepID=UPI0030F3D3D8
MNDQRQDITGPPLEPTGEIAADEQSDFRARCQAFVGPFLLKNNWEFQRGLVSRSPEWGLVWRGDYTIADLAAPNLVNRIMCWESADGQLLTEIAVGQRIEPLPAESFTGPGGHGT